jgi:hypothetical protein
MGMRLCSGITPEWIQPDGCEAKFYMKPLDSLDYAEFRVSIKAGTGEISAESMRRTFQKSLLDWEGVEDEQGKPVKFDLSRISDIPTNIILNLINKVYEISQLRDNEKKA